MNKLSCTVQKKTFLAKYTELMKKLWNHIDDNLSEEKFEEIITCLIKDNKEELMDEVI